MQSFSRVTVVGPSCRVNLALPSNEQLGLLMPALVNILEISDSENASYSTGEMALHTVVGSALGVAESLASSGIGDGAILYLIPEQASPAPPLIGELTEETVADLDQRSGRWNATCSARLTTTLAAVLAVLLCTQIAVNPSAIAIASLAAAALICWCVGSIAALSPGQTDLVGTVHIVGSVLGAGALLLFAKGSQQAPQVVIGWVGLLGAASIVVVRRANPIGRGALIGGGTAGLFSGLWLAQISAGVSSVRAAAVVLVVAAMFLGFLPSWALSLSGLTSLDDHRVAGSTPERSTLIRALTAAHEGLVWSVSVTCLALAVCGVYAVSFGDYWTIGIGALAAAVAAVRAGSFPLIVEVAAPAATAVSIGATAMIRWSLRAVSFGPIICCCSLLVTVIIWLGITPPEHHRVRLRSIADHLETGAMLALLPCVLGVFGIYVRLLRTFG